MEKLGQSDEASKIYAILADHSPSYPEAAWKIGKEAALLGNWTTAEHYFTQAYSINPEKLKYAIDLSGTCLESGKYQEVEILLSQAIQKHPENPYLLYNLACAKAQLGQPSTALKFLQECIRLGGPSFQRIAASDPQLRTILDAKAPRQPD